MVAAQSGGELWSKLRDDVSKDNLRRTVEDLFQWQRHSGTAGEYQAVAYLVDRLHAYGIDAHVKEYDGLISNPLVATITIHAGEYRTIQCTTHPFSASAPGGITADVVAAGETPGEVDVAGKIALVDGAGTPWSVNQWLMTGAVGLICHSHAKVVQEYIISGVWGTPEPETAKNLPAIPVVSVDAAAGDYLRSQMTNGSVQVTLHTRLDTGIKSLQFPVADIPGTDGSDEFVLIAGHLDSWYFGAQDNAAGDAALLELARILNERRDALKRSVRIAWWVGHSHGRFSASAWYCDSYWDELAQHCVGYLNVDQPGHHDATWLHTFATPEARRFLSGMVRQLAGQEVWPPEPPRQADQSFWGVGLPSFSFLPRLREGSPDEAPDAIGDRKPWYQHTAYDTVDKLDFDLLVEHTSYFLATMAELSRCGTLPWDHADTADAFVQRLSALNEAAGTALDLAPCLDAAERLKRSGKHIRALQKDSSDTQRDDLNRALMRASQRLLNVYYMPDKYHQAPALPYKVLPGISDIVELTKLPSNSEQYVFLKTKLIRERNRIAENLRWSAEELEQALARV